jgi:aldehyde:ferredoxin oxidoreductase
MRTQWMYSFCDTAALCQFVYGPAWGLYSPQDNVDLVHAVTGWDMTIEDMLRIGERRVNLLKMFNACEGIGREADILPERLFNEPRGCKLTYGACVSA